LKSLADSPVILAELIELLQYNLDHINIVDEVVDYVDMIVRSISIVATPCGRSQQLWSITIMALYKVSA
jgi:hypothetical protein